MQPAGRLERRLPGAQSVRQSRNERCRDRQLAFDAGRLDGHCLERSLAADAAGRGGVEVSLQPADVRAGRVDVDRVGGEVVRNAGAERRQAFGEAEPERELLVVSGRPHGHGHRHAADPDLEGLFDGDHVAVLPTGHTRDANARDTVRGHPVGRRLHGSERIAHLDGSYRPHRRVLLAQVVASYGI